ncbi:MAG: sugar transferase [Pseudobdellovibrio sp.]
MKRCFDLVLALVLFFIFLMPLCLIAILVKMTSSGPALHWSLRVGKNNKNFLMPKFRSMYTETPQVATHLLENSDKHVTALGSFLRKTSLDELPQLLTVISGKMSLVGPRPALFNQDDLIELRTKKGIEQLRPGVTGWAQVNGRDDLPIPVKVEFDYEYLKNMNFFFDIKILVMTFFKVLKPVGIKH